MAHSKCKIEGFDQIDKLFSQISRPQEFCEKAITEAAPILLKSTKDSVKKAIQNPPTERKGESEITGQLVQAFIASKVKTNQWGSFTSIQPTGTRSDKKSGGKPLHFAAQAAFLEWGTKRGQAPSPWRARAVKDAEDECADTMEKTFLREVNKVWPVEEG